MYFRDMVIGELNVEELRFRPREELSELFVECIGLICARFGRRVSSVSSLCFSSSGKFLLFSSCYSRAYSRFRFGPYGPDKTQQFAAHRCDDLSFCLYPSPPVARIACTVGVVPSTQSL